MNISNELKAHFLGKLKAQAERKIHKLEGLQHTDIDFNDYSDKMFDACELFDQIENAELRVLENIRLGFKYSNSEEEREYKFCF